MSEEKRHVIVVKADGEREPFNREKLVQSLARVGTSPEVVEKVVTHIEAEIMNEMSTTDIYRHAFSLLRDFEKRVAARDSLGRGPIGRGPTGFAFEDYIGEVFRAYGYQVEVGKMVQGHCVSHEVDLIAYDSKKLIMGELKFHNELGYKSDLKVALYVKARMDDLKGRNFMCGGKSRSIDEGLLLTNTKFTQTAIQYATCSGLPLIGWNYPEGKGNLQEMIETKGLHPISCLSSLTHHNREDLYKRGVVLCKTLLENKDILLQVGIRELQLEEVLDEVRSLFTAE